MYLLGSLVVVGMNCRDAIRVARRHRRSTFPVLVLVFILFARLPLVLLLSLLVIPLSAVLALSTDKQFLLFGPGDLTHEQTPFHPHGPCPTFNDKQGRGENADKARSF